MTWLTRKARELIDRASAWQLPVRIQVPSREEVLATGLSALALGLVLGLATGPVSGPAAILPAFAAPLAEAVTTEEEEAIDLPSLGSPAGTASGGVTTAAAVGPALQAAPATVPVPAPTPATPTPAGGGGGGGGGEGGGGDEGEGDSSIPLTATAVSVSVTGRSYGVVDGFGNMFTVFGNGAPGVGDRLRTSVEPLANGMFAETADRTLLERRSEVPMRGIVSYLDAETGVVVLSSRGVSVAVDGTGILEQPPEDLREGANVESEVEFVELESGPGGESNPGLSLVSVEATFLPDNPIELTGELNGIDRGMRIARFSADSGGVLQAEVEAVLPGALDATTLKVGFQYSVTLRRANGGALRVAGLSPAWGKRPANDPALAFGEHG